MASDDEIDVRDARGATRGVITRKVLSRNGTAILDDSDQPVTLDNAPSAQVVGIAFAQGTTGNVEEVDPGSPLPTADFTPLWTPIAAGGVDVDPDTATLIAPAVGRLLISVNLLDVDTDGGDLPETAKLWIGWGSAAVEGRGDWLALNGRTDLTYFAGDVHVLLKGHDAAVRVTWQEWAAG